MPRIERKLSFTRDFFSAKRPFSIEDLGSLLSDPMGLFQKRKDKLARAGTDVTVHLGISPPPIVPRIRWLMLCPDMPFADARQPQQEQNSCCAGC